DILVRLLDQVGVVLADLGSAHAHPSTTRGDDVGDVHIEAREALVLDHEADAVAARPLRLGIQVVATLGITGASGHVLAPGHAHFLGRGAEPGRTESAVADRATGGHRPRCRCGCWHRLWWRS